MKLRNVFAMMCVISMFAMPVWAQWQVVYENDFDNLSDPLTGWSSPTSTPIGIGTTPSGRNFLGPFDEENDLPINVTLTLNGLPTHTQARVSFDLFVIGSWDGDLTLNGPDIWGLQVDGGSTLIQTTFNHDPQSSNIQNYPDWYPGPSHPGQTGADEIDSLGYTAVNFVYSFPIDDSSTNDGHDFTFNHAGSTLGLTFYSDLWSIQPEPEMWGLDNVIVEVPEPATLSLLAIGGLALIRKRR